MPGFKMTMGGARPSLRTSSNNATVALFMEDVSGKPTASKAPEAAGEIPEDKGGQDSLDAFMAGIDDEATRPQGGGAAEKAKAGWEELQSEDPVASYCEAYEKGERGIIQPRPPGKQAEGKAEGADAGEADEAAASDGEDENADRRTKPIEPLPRVDHSQIDYAPVQKDFYKPHPEISSLSADKVADLRKELRISVAGSDIPSVVASFVHLGLPKELMEGIRLHGYTKPTAIQAQAIPAGLSGRDVVGIAETGSGKTVAYLMPLLVHCAAQPPLQKGEGPIGLVLCPTRELAVQIEKETHRFSKSVGLRSTTLAGGLSKYQQFKEIKGGSEIVIATPGRMIDIVKMKGCSMQRCTFVVLDEADRMLQMGFEQQMRSIVQNVRPSRQTLLFSATFPPKIERTCTDLLQAPVRITIGKLGQAAENIRQSVEVLASDQEKWAWLSARVDTMLSKGQLLVFCRSRQGSEDLAKSFAAELQRNAAVLHGDLDQDSRLRIMESVRKGQVHALIATDLAARGLDVPSIRTVVSYDAARDIETHTHRVGRTGRAGAEGDAFTLLVSNGQDRKMAGLLLEHLEQAGWPVTADLLALAMQHPPFRAARLCGQADSAGSKRRRTWEAQAAPSSAATAVPGDVGGDPDPTAAPAAVASEAPRSRSRSPSPPSPPPTP
mmetsp:Transcript_11294/g.30775  ORF Transcript_11294/g.30775 Transcript_11294/m.30775 type:complete len:665 (-) Transcript_11294:25-2019(-)